MPLFTLQFQTVLCELGKKGKIFCFCHTNTLDIVPVFIPVKLIIGLHFHGFGVLNTLNIKPWIEVQCLNKQNRYSLPNTVPIRNERRLLASNNLYPGNEILGSRSN
jgi:hypothetical protein